MTDVLLVAGDVEEPAHSLILSLHSAYFKTLFQVFCRTLAIFLSSLSVCSLFPFSVNWIYRLRPKENQGMCPFFLSKSYN